MPDDKSRGALRSASHPAPLVLVVNRWEKDTACITLMNSVDGKFKPRRHAELVENAKQIVPHGMLTEAKL
jgi:hypothetical protein